MPGKNIIKEDQLRIKLNQKKMKYIIRKRIREDYQQR